MSRCIFELSTWYHMAYDDPSFIFAVFNFVKVVLLVCGLVEEGRPRWCTRIKLSAVQ